MCAFNTNIDHVVRLSGSAVEALCREVGYEDAHPSIIEDEVDVLSALLYCMREGVGREVVIDEPTPLENLGLSGIDRLGGNAANTAAGLAALGSPALLNVAAPSKRQMTLIPSGVYAPLNAFSEIDLVHTVLEFTRGDVVHVGDRRIVVPESDRLIITYDPLNTRMVVNRAFEKELLEKLDGISAALASGFHLLRRRRDARDVVALLKRIHAQCPKLKIHAELGSPADVRVLWDVVRSLKDVLFSISMNEQEAAELFGGSWSGMGARERMHEFFEYMGMHALCVHSTHVVYCMTREPEVATSAARLGARCAGVLALRGHVSRDNLHVPLATSTIGMRTIARLSPLEWGGHSEVLVPAYHVEHRVTSTGLGDAFTAGFLRVLGESS